MRQIQIKDEGLNFIYCYGCKAAAHLYCIGIQTSYDTIKSPRSEELNFYTCEVCLIEKEKDKDKDKDKEKIVIDIIIFL